jgi:hypothetical protein
MIDVTIRETTNHAPRHVATRTFANLGAAVQYLTEQGYAYDHEAVLSCGRLYATVHAGPYPVDGWFVRDALRIMY